MAHGADRVQPFQKSQSEGFSHSVDSGTEVETTNWTVCVEIVVLDLIVFVSNMKDALMFLTNCGHEVANEKGKLIQIFVIRFWKMKFQLPGWVAKVTQTFVLIWFLQSSLRACRLTMIFIEFPCF